MASTHKKVLIVDDDPAILRLLAESLAVEHEHYEVLTAPDGKKALEILSRQDVFLVISDIKMSEISGLHLLAEIRAHYPKIEVILMTGFGSEEIRTEVQQSGCLHFMEKPLEIEHLKQLVREQVTIKDEGFAGTLKNIQLTDLIQMCCLSGISIIISVTKDSQQGTIFIQNGEIVHATCGNWEGETAFYKILAWESGSFETLNAASDPEISIKKNAQYLLMEAARLADEQASQRDERAEESQAAQLFQEHENLRVLVVDDSAMMCRIITDILTAAEDITVVGTAKNGVEALKKINELKPDLITLDVNMPVMDGSTALKHIMIKNPCPVVIISSLGSRSGMNVLDFLRLGAVDFISKPTKTEDISHHQQEIIERVRLAGKARIDNFRRVKTLRVLHEEKDKSGDQLPCKQLVVVNSGVGGHAELIKMVPLFPREVNACLILLQTMPPEFVAPLANYLNKRSRSLVLPLQTEVPLSAGRCYIGTNNFSLKLTLKDEKYNLWLEDTISKSGQLYNCFDFFLHSIADSFCDRVMVVLLSGADVGDLDGLRRIRKRNGRIITQKTTSCMVPYPLEKAIEADLVEMEANLDEIAKTILLTAHI